MFQNGKRGWGYAVAALALTSAAVAPPFLAGRHPVAAWLIRCFFAHVCHQIPSRSFVLDGSPAAVCVRCLGIYCGAALTTLLPLQNLPARTALSLALLLNLADVCAQCLHGYGNVPLLRFCLGTLLGIAVGAVLFTSPGIRGKLEQGPRERKS